MLLLTSRSVAVASVEVVGASQLPDQVVTGDTWNSGGSLVRFILRNTGEEPVKVDDVTWNRRSLEEHLAGPDYGLVWWRSEPEQLPPGDEGILTLSLRTALSRSTDFLIRFSNQEVASTRVGLEKPAFRLGGIAFSPDLDSAVCYIEQLVPGSAPPRQMWLNGQLLRGEEVRWLASGYTGGILPVVVTPSKPFQQGSPYLFRVGDGTRLSASVLRAFHGWTRFGTCGYDEFERFAEAGLNHYFSFRPLSGATLDRLQQLGMTTAMMVPPELDLDQDAVGHPALHSWIVTDEPDVQDYSEDPDRPENLRVGTLAPRMVEQCAELALRDPATPAAFTLNLTFVPENYCIYGSIPDLLMPDSYPVTHGQPLTNFRNYAAMARRAAAPRPFLMVYQGCWEEWANPMEEWMGRQPLLERGWEPFVDTSRLRGFGRAPDPMEVVIQILYAVGNGSKGALSYTDATEVGQGWVFHGSKELPEVWDAITTTSRTLRMVTPLIEMGHPIAWAETNQSNLWVSTITTAGNGALVVVVNEDHVSDHAGFHLTPANETEFTFPDLPWERAGAVFRLTDGGLEPVAVRRLPGRTVWSRSLIEAGEVYLVTAHEAFAEELQGTYEREAPVATAEGMQILPETYLQGRRHTLPQQSSY